MKHTPLYPFQREGVRRIRDMGCRALLADEPGLGKTLQSLYCAWRYVPEDPPGPVVVVCHSHLKLVWKRQAEHHLGIRVEVLSGETVPPDKLYPLNPNQTYVVNYDVLVPDRWRPRTPLPANSWTEFLRGQNPRLVILDEAHALANPTSARTRACRKLCAGVPHVLALTGTPMANHPPNLWPILNILDPVKFGNHFEFCAQYAYASREFGSWKFTGARNLDQLHNALQDVMVRRRLTDVLHDLPPIIHTAVPFEVDLRKYRESEKAFVKWLDKKSAAEDPGKRKAVELSKLTALRLSAARLKLPHAIKWAQDTAAESGGKLLLGALHYSITGPLMRAFGRAGVLLDGRLNADHKQGAIDRFNTDPSATWMVANIHAGGTGWSCTATSDVALCEMPWRPADVTQFAGRVHGIARGAPGAHAHLRFLVAAGTIEESVCNVVERKSIWADAAIDGGDGDGRLEVYTQVMRAIRERVG